MTTGDRLDSLFAMQAALDEYLQRMRPAGFYQQPKRSRVPMWIRALLHEVIELEDSLGWKPWKAHPAPDREHQLEEYVDILHFWLQLGLDLEFTPEEIYRAFCAKHVVNRERQQSTPGYRPKEER